MTRNMYGSIAYEDYQNIDGFMVPFNMSVMLNDGVIESETF